MKTKHNNLGKIIFNSRLVIALVFAISLPVVAASAEAEKSPANQPHDMAHMEHIVTQAEAPKPGDSNQTTLAADQEHAEDDDDHQHDQHEKSVFAFIGGFHVLAIHFPIALLVTAAIVALINLYFKKQYLQSTAIIQTHVGSISSLGSTLLGWSTWMEANYPGAEDTLFWHQWLGTTTCLCALAASCAIGTSMQEAKHPRMWLILLVTSGILVSITGHFGGTLIYG